MEIAYPTTRTRRMHARPARGVSGRVCLLVCAIADIVGRHATNCRDSPLSLSLCCSCRGRSRKAEKARGSHARCSHLRAGREESSSESVVAGMRLPEADVMPLTSIVHSRVFQARIHPTRRSRDPSDNKIKDV
jgi:hypothetical protein